MGAAARGLRLGHSVFSWAVQVPTDLLSLGRLARPGLLGRVVDGFFEGMEPEGATVEVTLGLP